jgi:hypothetical protein
MSVMSRAKKLYKTMGGNLIDDPPQDLNLEFVDRIGKIVETHILKFNTRTFCYERDIETGKKTI